MPGNVHVDPSGAVTGWAFRSADPGASARVELLLDGSVLARVVTSEVAEDARSVDARARCAGFVYTIPPELRDGRVHELRARFRWEGELAGSPAVWEPRRADAPARSFVLERDALAPDIPGVVPLARGGWVRFERGGREPVHKARKTQLLHNREEIGGLPGHRHHRPHIAYLASFRDHVVDASYGGLYRPEGALWQGATYLSNTIAQKITRHRMRQGELVQAPGERCFLLCNSVKDIYFHWHLDSLAGLVMARKRFGSGFRTLAPTVLKPWQSASLELLSEDVELMAGACRPAETLVASHLDGRGIYPDRWVKRMFRRLGRAHARSSHGRPSRGLGPKVFVSREDAAHRVLENEAELWSALQNRGFVRFTPGEASYREQIDVFVNAKVVVASHGSALTNIGFCRPGTQVVEILPTSELNGCFRYLAITMGLRHAWYSSDLVQPFRVDVEDFTRWCDEHDLV